MTQYFPAPATPRERDLLAYRRRIATMPRENGSRPLTSPAIARSAVALVRAFPGQLSRVTCSEVLAGTGAAWAGQALHRSPWWGACEGVSTRDLHRILDTVVQDGRLVQGDDGLLGPA